ncbi:MAG: Hsp70 family protein [Acidimicrobiales bacterium]
MSFILGLDVGTASGAGATKRDGRVQPSALGDRTATLPSVVVLHDDGTTLVGEDAERVAGFELPRIARDIRVDPDQQQTPIKVGGHVHTPHQLLRTLYSTIVERVCLSHNATPSHVVLTHPSLPEGVHCEIVDRLADELFPGAMVVPEPIAAAVKLACDGSLPADCIVAVYDFGGGTFDLTLVRRDGDRFSMVGDPAGLPQFGGIDVDDLVLDHVNRSLDGAITRLDLADPAGVAALTHLRAECRDAKERLSYETEVTIDASLPDDPRLVRLTRSDFDSIVLPNLEGTIDVLERAIAEAGLRPGEVDTVALVGGSSRIPLVAELLGARTSIPVLVDPYPELTVALGACQMVDDEAPSSSVFPFADLALPTLAAFSETGAATGGGFAAPPPPPGEAPAGAMLGEAVGRLSDPYPGQQLDPALGDELSSESEFDQLMQRGRDLDGGSGPRTGGGFPDSLNPKVGVAVLAGIVLVLLVGVILLGGGGDGSPGEAETAGASGTTQNADTSSSAPSSSTSSSSSSTTSSSTTTTDDDGEDTPPPPDEPPATDPPPPSTSPPTTRPRPTTTTTTTTTSTTTTSTTTTTTPGGGGTTTTSSSTTSSPEGPAATAFQPTYRADTGS